MWNSGPEKRSSWPHPCGCCEAAMTQDEYSRALHQAPPPTPPEGLARSPDPRASALCFALLGRSFSGPRP